MKDKTKKKPSDMDIADEHAASEMARDAEKKKLKAKEDKKNAKLAKKEKKRRKKEAKYESRRRSVVLNPFLITTNTKYYLGLSARAFAISFSVFALLYFTLDTLNIMQYTSNWFLLLCSVLFTAPIVFSTQLKPAIFITAGAGVLWLVFIFAIKGVNPFDIVRVFTNIADYLFARLGGNGFGSFMGLKTGFGLIRNNEITTKYIAVCLSFIFSLVYGLSFGKTSHLVAPVILNILIVAPSFVCNITKTNWGAAFIFVAYCVIAVMYVSDKLFTDMTNPKRYDTETVLNPAAVIGVDIPLTEDKRDKKEKKKATKKQEKVLLDDELGDLLSAPKPKKKKKTKKAKLTKEEKAEIRLKKQTAHLKKFAKSAVSGFTALSILVVGYLSVLLPASIVSKNFKKLSFMDETMSNIREYITALLLGDNVSLDIMSYERDPKNFEPRTTDLTPREFLNIGLFDVEVQRVMPIYLRGWVSNSYKDGAWYLDTEAPSFTEYREIFGVKDSSHEALYQSFIEYMLPSSVKDETNYLTGYTLNQKYGFVTMQVNVARYFDGSTSLYAPAFLNPKYGIRSFRSVYEDNEMTCTNFFDGLFVSRYAKYEGNYAAVVNVPTMSDPSYSENISRLIAEYNAEIDYIKYVISGGAYSNKDDAEGEDNLYYFKAHDVSSANNALKNADSHVPVNAKDLVGTTPLGYSFRVERSNALVNGKDVQVNVITVNAEHADYIYTYETSSGKLVSKELANVEKNPETSAPYVFEAPDLELAVRYFHVFGDKAKAKFNEFVDTLSLYRDYVYKYYTETSGSEIVSEFAAQFAASANDETDDESTEETTEKNLISDRTYAELHELILSITNTMLESFEYTLEPSSMGDPTLTGVENFIANVKEGYCVQFASTLALTLRELGIPARYVEGYVATDFRVNAAYKHIYDSEDLEYAPDGLYFRSRVEDNDAHSWVEVWFDGIGWVQYEATPSMLGDFYPSDEPDKIPPESETDTDTSNPEDGTSIVVPGGNTDTLPPDDTTPIEGGFKIPESVIYIGIGVIAVALVTALIIFIKKRAEKADKAKEKFIQGILECEDDEVRCTLTHALSDRIFELLGIYGMSPDDCELPPDYRLRLAREITELKSIPETKEEKTEDYDATKPVEPDEKVELTDEDILASEEYVLSDKTMEALEAEEFGHGMNRDCTKYACDCYAFLLSVRKNKLSAFETLIYRYILNKL